MSSSTKPLLVFFLLAVCHGGEVRAEETCRWKIPLGVDSLFTPRERAEIVVAAANWTAASGNQICFIISSRDTSDDERAFRTDRDYVIYSRRRPWQVKAVTTAEKTPCPTPGSCVAMTIWEYGGRWSDIFVLTFEVGILRATVEHELGHLLGLKHTAIYQSTMFDRIRRDKRIAKVDRDALACLMTTQALLLGTDVCTPKGIRRAH